jgi:TM2 domain-containing membrane protein YozV
MKLKFLLINLIAVLFLSSCARETYYFPKVGDPYGSYKKKTPATTPEQVITATDLLPQTAPVQDEAVLTASIEKVIVAPVKTKLTLAKATAATKQTKTSKFAEIKTAIKVKREVKAIIKAAEKKEQVATPSEAAEGKSQIIAAVLAFVVGVLGIHRFYLGYTGIGIAQLLTLGGCGIWSLIDLIRIIIGDLKPKDGDYTEKF